MFAFIVSILAQFEGASVAESDAVSTAYKFNVETLCGVLILLMFGNGIGIDRLSGRQQPGAADDHDDRDQQEDQPQEFLLALERREQRDKQGHAER